MLYGRCKTPALLLPFRDGQQSGVAGPEGVAVDKMWIIWVEYDDNLFFLGGQRF